MKSRIRTPWGDADYVKEYAEGITFYGTPGHGGFKLDRKHNAMVDSSWRKKSGWYEEDVEWAIAAFTFPNAFSESDRKQAEFTVKDYYPDEYTKITGKELSLDESRVLRERKALKDAEGKWSTVCAYGEWHPKVPTGMVGVCTKVNRQGPSKYFLVPANEYKPTGNLIGFIVNPEIHQEVEAF